MPVQCTYIIYYYYTVLLHVKYNGIAGYVINAEQHFQ